MNGAITKMEQMDKIALCQSLSNALGEFQKAVDRAEDFSAIRHWASKVQYYVGILDELDHEK